MHPIRGMHDSSVDDGSNYWPYRCSNRAPRPSIHDQIAESDAWVRYMQSPCLGVEWVRVENVPLV